ncbi:MAG: GDSL-type esterase/lipase family protein [Myxococcota bacterium]
MRTAARALLVLAGLAVGLAIVELGVRVLDARRETADLRALHVLRPDAGWLYELRANAVAQPAGGPRYATNSLGFRDRERALAKPPGAFRVVAIGDSVTFGFGVELEEAWPSRLEERLRAVRPDAEVLDLGIGGYNPYTESELLRGRGLAFAPDVVLVQFCVNDLADPTIHFDHHARTRLGALPDAAFPDPSQRTHAARGLSLLERACLASRACSRAYDAWLARAQATLDEPTRRAGARPADAADGPAWDWLAARYREMARASRASGARFALVLFPHFEQLAGAPGSAPDPLQQRLVRLARDEGIAAVDLLEPFRRASRAGRPPMLDYFHPDARGHAIAAQVVAEELGRAGILPSGGAPAAGAPAPAAASAKGEPR